MFWICPGELSGGICPHPTPSEHIRSFLRFRMVSARVHPRGRGALSEDERMASVGKSERHKKKHGSSHASVSLHIQLFKDRITTRHRSEEQQSDFCFKVSFIYILKYPFVPEASDHDVRQHNQNSSPAQFESLQLYDSPDIFFLLEIRDNPCGNRQIKVTGQRRDQWG
jgi:hypothetical protein